MRKKSLKEKKGQFIIIAVLFIATMIISMGALLSSTSTYYKYEPWEEYITLIDGVRLNSLHLVELSLSNYTLSNFADPSILNTNLNQWQSDLANIYPGYGISLDYEFSNENGIELSSNSYSTAINANVDFYLNISNLGLTGYSFDSTPFLNLTILPYSSPAEIINVTVTSGDNFPVFDLERDNFKINNDAIGITAIDEYYDDQYILIYSITCDVPITSPVTISVCDHRGLKLTATR